MRKLLGFRPRNIDLYKKAFRHLSASEKILYTDQKDSNERLEYLGDAVLDLIVAELVFRKFPFKGEGFLTEIRSKIVSRKQLSYIAQKLGLHDFLETEQIIAKNPHVMNSLAGNALEALVGAIYIDRGYKASKRFVYRKVLKPYIDLDEIQNQDINYKSMINQWAQKNKKNIEFRVIETKEEGNNRKFKIALEVDGIELCQAQNYSKKLAEKMACAKAAEILKLEEN
ncbi:MAG: ribonuclease III [Flavobacteriales bacterium]|nr:ribonuclease III [Flavobacteriales bacterium]